MAIEEVTAIKIKIADIEKKGASYPEYPFPSPSTPKLSPWRRCVIHKSHFPVSLKAFLWPNRSSTFQIDIFIQDFIIRDDNALISIGVAAGSSLLWLRGIPFRSRNGHYETVGEFTPP